MSLDKYPNRHFNEKRCRKCGDVFQPKSPSELYCSIGCREYMHIDRYMKRNYSISYGLYREMYIKQGGKCAICGGEGFLMREGTHKHKLVVDHCHDTGKVRGLLCHNCNRALGLFQDDPNILQTAKEYLDDCH